jgi:hypothetical protein
MKKLIFGLFLVAPLQGFAQTPPAPTVPAAYTVTVHVVGSHLTDDCSSTCVWAQHLSVTIDGKKYELEDASPRTDLLHIGDYKAKIVKEDTSKTYAYLRTYEFLFADGQTRKYIVVGEGE